MGKPNNITDRESRLMLEQQWVRRVREKGDRTAFKKIFRSYYKRLHGFAYTFVECRQEAEDVVQSVFLNIWARRDDWNPAGELKSYLFKAVKNEALNVIRHQKVVDDAEDEVIRTFRELKKTRRDEDYETRQLRRDIEKAIDRLPPRCRQIFLLNRKSGLTYAEIADFLDLSVGTVNTQMGRALRSLRDYLSDYLSMGALLVCVDLMRFLLTG